MINIVLLAIFAGCVAFVYNEGLWGAAVLFVNVLLAAVLATNLFEPVANWLEGMMPGATYLWDFVGLWGSFAVVLVISRLATDMISRHRVRFKKPVDIAGGFFFAAWIGWIMVMFSAFSLHLAPLGRSFAGFQETPDAKLFFGLAPDRTWMAFNYAQSKTGALARTPSASNPEEYVFDWRGDLILRYGSRRKAYETETGFTVKSN